MFKRILLLLAVLVLGALALEAMARVIHALQRGKYDPVVPGSIKRYDPQLGWSLAPDTRITSRRTGYTIEYRINSKGLRDEATDYLKPEGVFRIVLIGDSRTFGYGVPIEKHFSRLLEGYFERVEVINLGVGGYGVDQELLSLRGEGFKYQPDLVLVYVAHYENHRHMHSLRFGRHKPKFVLGENGLVLTHIPVPLPERSLNAWLRKNSRFYRDYVAHRLGGPSAADRERELDRRNRDDPEFIESMNRLGEALVLEMQRDTARHGAEFALVTQIDRLHAFAEAQGLASLRVTPSLYNEMFDLPENFEHINEAGNGVLAWEIVSFLSQHDLVPQGHRREP